MASVPRVAVFLDRDGVINEERHYVYRINDFVFLPGVVPSLQRLQNAGFALVVVTNQGGIGRGLYSEADMDLLHRHMQAQLGAQGVQLSGIYHCPHHPEGVGALRSASCNCRKPRPGMLLQAAQDLGLDLSASVMVGDKRTDITAARAAGLGCALLVRSGHDVSPDDADFADGCFANLAAATHWILTSNVAAESRPDPQSKADEN